MEWWPTTACTPGAPVYTPNGPTAAPLSAPKENNSLDQVVTNTTLAPKPAHGVSLGEAFRVWLRVALLSFGGPAGQIAVMHRIIVEEKRWISENRFLHALNYCMLLPGPEAQQLATYIGWLMHRTLGGVIAGMLFVLPGVIAIMTLSWIYALYGKVGIVSALFFGLKAAVLAVVLEAVIRIGKKSLKNNVMVGLAAAAFIAIFFMKVPFPIIILLAGVIGFLGGRAGLRTFDVGGGHGPASGKDAPLVDALLGDELPVHARPTMAKSLRVAAVWLALWLVPVFVLIATLGEGNVFSQIAIFFSKMAMVTFGGAYAVLAYVAQQAVENYGWLAPGEMLDGLGMAETTPGPLIMVLQFVGFMGAFRDPGGLSPLMAGTLGGLLATWVTFTPCFLWIFLGAPFIETLRGNKPLAGALSAITAAVVGVVLNLAIWFAIHTIFAEARPVAWGPFAFDAPVLSSVNVWALLLSVAAVVAMFRFKVGMIPTIAACSAAGITLYLAGAIS
jgi:chromate transporter